MDIRLSVLKFYSSKIVTLRNLGLLNDNDINVTDRKALDFLKSKAFIKVLR